MVCTQRLFHLCEVRPRSTEAVKLGTKLVVDLAL